MLSMSSRIALVALSVSIGLLSFGCVRVGDFSRNATRYNEAIEEAQNRMLLLNVVRAEMRRPMYITDLSKITGNIKLDVNSGGVETDYGPFVEMNGTIMSGAVNSVTATHRLFSGKFVPSLDYAHTPTFDVNSLSTQEFMNGFLKPVSKDLMAYYWEQGWPQELLLYLFVREVTISAVDDDTAPDEHYVNYPNAASNLAELEGFGKWVTKFVQKKPRFIRKDQSIGPCLDRNEASDLEDLVRASQASLGLAEVGGKYQLQQPKPDVLLMGLEQAEVERETALICKNAKKIDKTPSNKAILVAATAVKADCDKRSGQEGDPARKQINQMVCKDLQDLMDDLRAHESSAKLDCSDACSAAKSLGGSGTEGRSRNAADNTTKHEQVSAEYGVGKEKRQATLIIRAPEGVLYYLGELMRVEKAGLVPEICSHGRLKPLFVAFARTQVKQSCPTAIGVPYGGGDYMVPDSDEQAEEGTFVCSQPESTGTKSFKGLEKLHCSGGDSMQALSLLTQLIALQKSAKDTPTTSVIRAISQ
jgi:hypothetical protein